MPRVYKIITASLALIGSLSLVITGELFLPMTLPGLAMLVGYTRYIRGMPQAPKKLISTLSVMALLMLMADSVLVTGDFYLAVAHMTIAFQAIKSFDLKEPYDPLQVFFMSLLQLVITSELSLSIWVGAIFVSFLIMLLSAIVLSHFIKEGTLRKIDIKRPIAVVCVVAFVTTLIFFVAIPRARGGLLGRKATTGISSVGFTEKVEFGAFGEVLKDPTIVMRVELSGNKLPLYWRGMALDNFDGVSWTDSIKSKRRIYKTEGGFKLHDDGYSELTEQSIVSEPMDTDIIFGLGRMSVVKARGRRLIADSSGAVRMSDKRNRRFRYTVLSQPDLWYPTWYQRPYLQLPGATARIEALARDVVGDNKVAIEAAGLIESHLLENYEYSLNLVPPAPGNSAIEDFLFNSRKGFCEHYATAMILMLRSIGIPSRIVTGYLGGEVNEQGDYVIIRQQNAHSWVEAIIGGRWHRFDPTPVEVPKSSSVIALYFDSLRMQWFRYVVGFHTGDQRKLFQSFAMPVIFDGERADFKLNMNWTHVVAILGLLVILGVLYLVRGRSFKRYGAASREYIKFRAAVKKLGGRVDIYSSPEEVVAEARAAGMNSISVKRFIDEYQSARFGGKDVAAVKLKLLRQEATEPGKN